MTKAADLALGKIAALKTALIEFTDGDDAIAVADAGVVTLLTTAVAKSEGGAVTHNITQGLAKAWVTVNADESTVVAFDSFNVASVQDDAAGKYGITYTNNMNNANYLSNGVASHHSTSSDHDRYITGAQVGGSIDARRTTSLHKFGYLDSSFADTFTAGSSVHGDLA